MSEARAQRSDFLLVEGLRKQYGGLQAVDDCTFSVAAASITGIIGPNGAGKSTVFNLISGIEQTDAGRIVFNGRQIQGIAAHRIARLGLVRSFQTPRELRNMTVLDNIMFVPARQFGERMVSIFTRGHRVAAEERVISARAMAVLEQVELADQALTLAVMLSGGQKKLLELARCLMANPRLILLDEPTAGVNPRLIDDLMGVVKRIHAQGMTLVIIEHNMNVVMSLCDHVIVLDRGRVLCAGTPREVHSDPRVLEAYLGGPE